MLKEIGLKQVRHIFNSFTITMRHLSDKPAYKAVEFFYNVKQKKLIKFQLFCLSYFLCFL